MSQSQGINEDYKCLASLSSAFKTSIITYTLLKIILLELNNKLLYLFQIIIIFNICVAYFSSESIFLKIQMKMSRHEVLRKSELVPNLTNATIFEGGWQTKIFWKNFTLKLKFKHLRMIQRNLNNKCWISIKIFCNF